MTGVIERIRAEARARPRRLVLVEGEDERIVAGAARLATLGLADVTLLSNPQAVAATAARAGVDLERVAVEDPQRPESVEQTRAALIAARGERLASVEARDLARDPLFQAATLVRTARADCVVAGAVRTTADVVRSALWLLGRAPGITTVSSFFLMVMAPRDGVPERAMTFADCGVVPDPSPEQLAEIALLAADRHERLTGETPRTAFLSFSTHGSAEHPKVDKVRHAVSQARAARPDRAFDGELQVDAALDAEVAGRKAPGSAVAGRANVLVFPDLDAGNIGYKLVQRLAGAAAYGPILMGLARQATDLSRGCSTEDVVNVSTIACALCSRREDSS
jgi:phosphate acetyltransferase